MMCKMCNICVHTHTDMSYLETVIPVSYPDFLLQHKNFQEYKTAYVSLATSATHFCIVLQVHAEVLMMKHVRLFPPPCYKDV